MTNMIIGAIATGCAAVSLGPAAPANAVALRATSRLVGSAAVHDNRRFGVMSLYRLGNGQKSENPRCGHGVRTPLTAQVGKPGVDMNYEKPQAVWLLKLYDQFSFQMSTPCPIGHRIEISKSGESSSRKWRVITSGNLEVVCPRFSTLLFNSRGLCP